jgi:hypothetical protein
MKAILYRHIDYRNRTDSLYLFGILIWRASMK